MKKNLSQNYSYAYNTKSELINVSSAQRNEKYYCPICGELMTPHMGKLRRWHFVHKNIGDCSYESYLHKLAKIKIREAFLSSEQFMLSYNAKAVCSLDCPYKGFPKCDGEKSVEFDLRRYYDTCELEVPYNQYRADLLLKSSTSCNRPPVLIEIMVTHKCTEEKIRDGVCIIEIPIRSEEQIDNIVNSCKLPAVRYKQNPYRLYDENAITLYNFNKVEAFDPTGCFDEYDDIYNRKNAIVLCLNKKGKFYSFNCHCYEVGEKLPANVHYFVTEIATPWKEIFQGLSKRGVKICNAFLCKFSQQDTWGDRLCVLYKKHNLPRKPSPYNAQSCPHYRAVFEPQQDMMQMEQAQPTEQTVSLYSHRYYYHICNDIL